MSKKYLFFFLIIVFLLLFSSFCFAKKIARELEVNYPTLPSGETITPTTPITKYVKYMLDFGMLIGFLAAVLSLIVGGVLYIASAVSPEAKSRARSRISGAISGIILLATIYLIITTINPELRILKEPNLVKLPNPSPPHSPAGVYLWTEKNCPDQSGKLFSLLPHFSAIPMLTGDLGNNIKSVKIVHNPSDNLYYIAVLYDKWYYRGNCQYINPNIGCENVDPFASSISIYRYDQHPEDNPNNIGVTFYRKTFYEENGGFYKVGNEKIAKEKIYKGYLENLKFENAEGDCNVSLKEQDCIKWNLKGECIKRKCPNLAKENISSIKIEGEYFVILIYYDPSEETEQWASCQAFPNTNDANKQGPKQIKWEYIRRQAVLRKGKYPNWVLIFPVKEK